MNLFVFHVGETKLRRELISLVEFVMYVCDRCPHLYMKQKSNGVDVVPLFDQEESMTRTDKTGLKIRGRGLHITDPTFPYEQALSLAQLDSDFVSGSIVSRR